MTKYFIDEKSDDQIKNLYYSIKQREYQECLEEDSLYNVIIYDTKLNKSLFSLEHQILRKIFNDVLIFFGSKN